MHESQDKPRVEERLDQVEAKLIESEHRLYAALRNFVHRNDWPKGDPRRRAAWMALIWVWFAPVTIAVGGGTATLAVLIWQGIEISRQSTYFGMQNKLIAEQNSYFRDQLQKMDTQIREAKDATREAERTHLIEVLWGVKDKGFMYKEKVPIAGSRMRKEAMTRFVEIEHERLKQEGKIWDATQRTGERIDLSGAALSNLVLEEQDFGNAAEISFMGANLQWTNLIGTDLSGANLGVVDLRGAHLVWARLVKVDLIGANLSGADLTQADLSGADLSGSELIAAHLVNTILRGATLARSNLSGADLHQADLTGATLVFARFDDADLSGASLREADLAGVDLNEADLGGADLHGALVVSQNPAWLDTEEWYTEPTESRFMGLCRWRICRKADSGKQPSTLTGLQSPGGTRTVHSAKTESR